MTKEIVNNLTASISVGLVVVTLGAAFGELSGLGVYIGMLSASILSLITSIFAGSKFGVSSPTGPMTAAISVIIMADNKWIETHSQNVTSAELISAVLIVAAVILFLLNLVKVQKLIQFIPNLVISGFLNGIAILILLSQFRSFNTSLDLAVALTSFVLLLIFNNYKSDDSHPAIRLMLSSFGLIAVATIVNYFLKLPVSTVDVETSLSSIKVINPSIEIFDFETLKFIIPLAFELSLIALLDTLLTAVVIDNKSNTKTNHFKELVGQSASMFSIGLIGGLPGAQSTAPTMMLYKEGANRFYAKYLIALTCILCTFLFAGLLKYIPTAILAGVILKVAFDVADFTSIKALIKSKAKNSHLRSVIVLGTTVSTVLISLNMAVIFFTITFLMWNKITPKKWQISDLIDEKEEEGFDDEM
jgi:SulP family sulfate permease